MSTGARLCTGAAAKGSAPDNGALAGAWLAGFGRSVASAQVDRLGERLAAGDRQPHLTLGGYRVDLAPGPEDGEPGENAYTGTGRWQAPTGRDFAGPVDDRPGRPVATAMTGRDFPSGSSFLFTGGETAYRRWSGWASTAPLSFPEAHGTHGDGRLDLLGTDYARGRLLAGVALSHGSGTGGRAPGEFQGIGTSLHGCIPICGWRWMTGFRSGAHSASGPAKLRCATAMAAAARVHLGRGGQGWTCRWLPWAPTARS